MSSSKRFKPDWVLVNELAVGPAPEDLDQLNILHNLGIKVIFSLCSEKEKPMPIEASNKFKLSRFILPDHTYKRLPQIKEIINALDQLSQLKILGPVYVHCFAGIERSPILCMAWLIRETSLEFTEALEYLMEVHPATNPLPGQLSLIKNNIITLKKSKL